MQKHHVTTNWGDAMYIAKASEKICCTCNHWAGTRVVEEDGFVYSLKALEGICDGVAHQAAGTEFNRALTFPDTRCQAWEKWLELETGA